MVLILDVLTTHAGLAVLLVVFFCGAFLGFVIGEQNERNQG